jgi:hypothetical protein
MASGPRSHRPACSVLFYGALSFDYYVASNGKMTDEWRIGKDLEGNNRHLIEILSRKLPDETDVS